MCTVFKQSLIPPCVIPTDQMKRRREKEAEDMFQHTKRPKRGEHRHACTCNAKGKTPSPSLSVMCDTQLGCSPSCSPWAVHMSPICTLESSQIRAKAKYEWREHLLVFLQSQEQLFTFRYNQELQWCRVTLKRQKTGEGMRKTGSRVRQTAFWLRKDCC